MRCIATSSPLFASCKAFAPGLPAFLLFLLTVFPVASHAFQEYGSRLWQTEDGLPHNSVNALLQGADGYLWIGTEEGLVRFDGVRFTLSPELGMPQPVASSSVSALCPAGDGSFWVGLEQGKLVRWIDGKCIETADSDGLLANGVRRVTAGADGSLWIGTGSGVVQWREDTLTRFAPVDFYTNAVRALEWNGSALLVGTGSGLGILREEQSEVFQKRNGLPHSSIRDIEVDAGGTTWIATEAGLVSYTEGEFVHYGKRDGLAGNFVTALHSDQSGNLWIGTYDGLNRMVEGKIVEQLTDDGTALEPVSTITEDAEGNIWVGTRGGLYRFTRRGFSALTREHGLSHHTPVSVLEGRDGQVWIGLLSGGVNCWSNGQIRSYTSTDGLSSDLVLALHEGIDGTIWIGTDHLGGLNRWQAGVFENFGREHGFLSGITALLEGSHGNLWIGTRNGLFRQMQGRERIGKVLKNGMQSVGINAIHQDRRGTVWIGADSGLFRYIGNGFKQVAAPGLQDKPVLAIYEDEEKSLWIGTRGAGLRRMEGTNVVACTTEHGLAHDTIYEILEDDFGYFWMSSPKGIFRVPRVDLDALTRGETGTVRCTTYGKLDGVISSECMGVAKPAACKTRDGRLWFPTSKGMVIVDPGISMNKVAPRLVIEKVIADRELVARSSLDGATRVTIPPGRGDLEFHYTALSFQIPEKVLFKCMLEGVDRDWLGMGNRRSINYNNVAPGTYRFRVIACNNDGVWNEEGESITLVLRPHLWQSWWFQGMSGLLAIAVVGGGTRILLLRNLRRKLKALEQERAVEKERARIARDMHDDFGSRLTEALLACEQARQARGEPEKLGSRLERVSGVIRELADNMDTLVWMVNPRNDSLDKLVSYIQEQSHAVLELSSIRCRFEIASDIPPHPISSDVRHNLFLAFKEALNNALKYSAASEIGITISCKQQQLRVCISDNGKGFVRETVSESGNGLQNMEKRLRSIGGFCSITTGPGQGTRVELQVPVTKS